MNSSQIFEKGDIVRLRDDLIIKDFINIKNKRLVDRTLYTLMIIYNRLCGDSFDNTYVQILDLINEEYLFVEIVDSDKEFLINRCLFIHISFIDKNLLRTIFVDKNTEKRARRHDNKLKNSNYGKSKFFHKDKFKRE
jgi:hypothetical protein